MKGTLDCLNFVMSSLPTWQTNCRRTDLGVKKTTTTGKWPSFSCHQAAQHRTMSQRSLETCLYFKMISFTDWVMSYCTASSRLSSGNPASSLPNVKLSPEMISRSCSPLCQYDEFSRMKCHLWWPHVRSHVLCDRTLTNLICPPLPFSVGGLT